MRLAVFDCDGTLVDSHHAIGAVMGEAFALHGIGAPDGRALMGVVGLQLTEAIAVLLPEAPTDMHLKLTEDYRRIAGEHRASGAWRETLYPGAAETVRMLDGDGWLLGVATGKSLKGLRETLSVHGLDQHFVTLQTPDTAPGKPDPAMLLAAMRDTGTRAEQVIMIGDTTFDMEMAVNAGTVAVGVGWGYHEADRLKAAGATAVVNQFEDLPPMLHGLLG